MLDIAENINRYLRVIGARDQSEYSKALGRWCGGVLRLYSPRKGQSGLHVLTETKVLVVEDVVCGSYVLFQPGYLWRENNMPFFLSHPYQTRNKTELT